MTAFLTFLVAWSARSTVVIALAFGFCFVARNISAASKHVVWRAALAATLLIGVGMLVISQVGVRTPSGSPLAEGLLAPRIVATATSLVLPATEISQSEPAKAERGGNAIFLLSSLFYLAGAVWLAGRWLASLTYVLRVCRTARPMAGHQDTLLAGAQGLQVPFTLGCLRPVIVLPGEATSWPVDRLNAVLLHERAHMKRNDWFWQSVAAMNAAAQWFNPAAWVLASALRTTAEESADNEVLAAGMPASAYVKDLIGFASSSPRCAVSSVGFARRRGLAKRLKSLLAVGRDRRQAGRRLGLTMGAGFGLVAVVLAAYAPDPQTSPRTHSSASKFSDGVWPKILFVGDGASSELPTWDANGSPLPPGELRRIGSGYSMGSELGHREVAVCFELEGFGNHLENARSDRFDPVRLGGFNRHADIGGGETTGNAVRTAIFSVPDTLKTADLEIARGMGKFRAVAQANPNGGDFFLRTLAGPNGTRTSFKEGKPVATSQVPTTIIRFNLPSQAKDKDWRLLAFDAKGQVVPITMGFWEPITKDGIHALEASANLPMEKFDHFVIETRDYEWITVRHIHLNPEAIRP